MSSSFVSLSNSALFYHLLDDGLEEGSESVRGELDHEEDPIGFALTLLQDGNRSFENTLKEEANSSEQCLTFSHLEEKRITVEEALDKHDSVAKTMRRVAKAFNIPLLQGPKHASNKRKLRQSTLVQKVKLINRKTAETSRNRLKQFLIDLSQMIEEEERQLEKQKGELLQLTKEREQLVHTKALIDCDLSRQESLRYWQQA